VVDQGVTSISNFVLSVAVASVSSTATFGQFALLYSFYWLTTGFCRAAFGESVISDARSDHAPGTRSAPLFLALVVSVAVGTLGTILGVVFGLPIVAFGCLFLPLLVLQDVARYIAFALSRARVALASDLCMLLAQISLGLLLTLLLRVEPAFAWIVGWAAGGLAGLSIAVFRLKLGREPRHTVTWMAKHKVLSGSVGAEFLLNTGSQQFVNFLLPVVSSLTSLAYLKAAQVSIGPLNVLMSGIGLVLLPALFRVSKHIDKSKISRLLLGALGGLAVLSAMYLVIILILPRGLLDLAFGPSWSGAMPAAAIVVAQMLAMGVSQYCGYALRALGKPLRSTALSALVVPLTISLPLVGAHLYGATGAAMGLFVPSAASAILWPLAVRRTLMARNSPTLFGRDGATWEAATDNALKKPAD
jgi:O-antigen/teichoic acid export membrane protein